MKELETFKEQLVDRSARAVYLVESYHPLSPSHVAGAVIDKSLPRKEGTAELYGLPYRSVEIFVPVQWKGFD